VTPQRRAILGAFAGGASEHLSADEVHSRATAAVPELSRGTVYATLAELTELGLLAAVGSADPVRYETNAGDHEHFRCRLCLRLYDVALPAAATETLAAHGFVVERASIAAEGVCADCVRFDEGLREGARTSRAPSDRAPRLPDGLACSVVDSPLGPVGLAATPRGLVRLVFDDHADAPELRERSARRRGGQAARGHLKEAEALVEAYFAGEPTPRPCTVDWDAIDNVSVPTLRAVQTIGYGLSRSYDALRGDADARTRGLSLGTNPLAIVVPCHRVTRGREVPDAYVGGTERRRRLRQHERA
jgi:Fe2+ or Zn2+ uptake regulation protein/O6-methylguanine-DNA--protein-cysteine methyltransferase